MRININTTINIQNSKTKIKNNTIKKEKVTRVLDEYTNLFHVMDISFSCLRIIDPNEDEIKEAKKTNFVLEHIWQNIKLSITPKAHILFTHAMAQFELLGGTADKVEDFVEKSHQDGKKLDALTATMSNQCYRQQQLIHITRLWRKQDTCIKNTIKGVHSFAKRNFSSTRSKTDNNISKEKKRRIEIRDITKKEVIK